MTDLRRLTDDVWLAGQITTADLAGAAAEGVTLVINNRPDDEEPGQPSGAEIEAAARAAGMDYAAVPVRGRPTPDQAEVVGRALAELDGPALLYCRSGLRSAAVWAMAATAAGEVAPDEARALAAGAGYDLSGLPL